MQELKIGQKEYGQRLDKLLKKYLSQASAGFLYKMLRKKNITLNDKKAAGNEILQIGDSVKIYFTEETLEKFRGPKRGVEFETEDEVKRTLSQKGFKNNPEGAYSINAFSEYILYEDEQILLANKPVGMLSQKSTPSDISFVELLHSYLVESGQLQAEDLQHFRPGICNRLDRNTSGILAAGKTVTALQILNQAFADRSLHKYYKCPVFGTVTEETYLEGYLFKNEKTNQVAILKDARKGSQPIKTRFRPLETGKDATLLEVELITGRSHQIRAHLASIGHPLFGDMKYGDGEKNKRLEKQFGLRHQLLHAYKLEIPELPKPLSYLNGRSFEAPPPAVFERVWEAFYKH